TRRLFDLPATVIGSGGQVPTSALHAAIVRQKNEIISELATRQANWFEEEIEKLNFWAEDKRKGLKAELKDYDDQIALLKKEGRMAANLPDKLAIQKKLRDLDSKRDVAWKAYDADAKTIEKQKDELLDSVEERLKQTIEEKTIFTLKWSVV
ncbi:MAG: SNF2-related protein, partial [Anaerolineaceae bacterium]